MTRCACGYPAELHDSAGHCPLCACGRTPDGHEQRVCPGKPPNKAGNLPTLRRGSFRTPESVQYERRTGWGDVLFPVASRDAEVSSSAPLVPARYALSADEVAPAALKTGHVAKGAGWKVVPRYWREADGTEVSALALSRGQLRAVAYWRRKPGARWATDGAHTWTWGNLPRKVGVKVLIGALDVGTGPDVA